MNRKGFLVLVIVAVMAASSNTFAQMPEFKLSAGAGGYFTSDFGGGYDWTMAGFRDKLQFPYAGGGGFVFFDATFAELSFGFFGAGGDAKYTSYSGGTGTSYNYDVSHTGLDIGVLGKYPFALTEQFTLFPLLGITYRHIISLKDNINFGVGPKNPGDLSTLWFKLGAGADYAFTEHIFARLGILYGLRLANKFEKDMISYSGYTNTKTLLGHGLDVKLAVGYQF